MEAKNSPKDNLLTLFNEASFFQKLPRLEKIKQKPISILFKYALEKIGRFFNFRFPVIAKTFFSDRMKVILPETVSVAIYRYGVHEVDLSGYLLKTLKSGDVFVDGGAHYGYFSLLAARLGAEVHSFEASPSTFRILEQNIKSANIPKVRLNNVALWDMKGTINFLNLDSAFSGGSTAKPRDGMNGKIITVSAVSLDSYVQENGIQPTFVKLDLEGAELDALRGSDYVIKNFSPIFCFEVWQPYFGKRIIDATREAIDFLRERKYESFIYSPYQKKLEPYAYEPQEIFPFSNVIFIPQS